MPARLVLIAIERIILSRRREVLEMHRLTGVRSDSARDEHEPQKQLSARVPTMTGKKEAGLLRQIQQDSCAIEYPNVAVYDDRHLAVVSEGEDLSAELLAPPGIDGDGFVRQARLL